ELYGSAVESRFALDIRDVPRWMAGGPVPQTIERADFREERLRTLRARLSAAYKGVHALLMRCGAEDFRSGQPFDQTVFFDENVDIHHVFPEAGAKQQDIKPEVYDSIINKTPLSYRTNRIIGGVAPSAYLAKLEKGSEKVPPIERGRLDGFLQSHLIDPAILRSDDFEAFMADRQKRLLALIEHAMGKAAYTGAVPDEGEDVEADPDTTEAERTITAA